MITTDNIRESVRELTFELAITQKYDIWKGDIELLTPDGFICKANFIFMIDYKNENVRPFAAIGFLHSNTFKYFVSYFDGKTLKNFYKNAFSKFTKGRIEITWDELFSAKKGTLENFKTDTLKSLNFISV